MQKTLKDKILIFVFMAITAPLASVRAASDAQNSISIMGLLFFLIGAIIIVYFYFFREKTERKRVKRHNIIPGLKKIFKFAPDILILLGISLFAHQLFQEKIKYITRLNINKFFAIILIALGIDITIRMYLKHKNVDNNRPDNQ